MTRKFCTVAFYLWAYLTKNVHSQQQYIKGGSITKFGQGSDIFNSVLVITNAVIKLVERGSTKGLCCYSDEGGFCADDTTHSTPHRFGHVIGYAKGNCARDGDCNAFACECQTKCRINSNERSGITVYLKDSIRGKYDKYFGRFFRLDSNNDCLNLEEFNDQARTILTFGNCIRIWEDADCSGDHADLQHAIYRRLKSVLMSASNRNFDYSVSSLSRCGPPSNKVTMTSGGVVCLNQCGKHGETSYFWCDESFSDFGVRRWNYCSPREGVSSSGKVCLEECGNEGGTRNSWCRVQDNSWDYCSRSLHNPPNDNEKLGTLKRDGSVECITPCLNYGKSYTWCYYNLDGNWEYCKSR